MNLRLLQQWLELRDGDWPPNHYRLLGLPNGEGEADEIEMRVLQRMETLRNYQLLHPELVTEGMNRLAQALNCLTELEARQQYDRTIGVRSSERKSFVQEPSPIIVKPEVPQNVLPDEIPLPLIPELEDEDSPRRQRKMESVLLEREGQSSGSIPPTRPRRRRTPREEPIPEAVFVEEEAQEDEPLVLEVAARERKKKAPKLPPLQLPAELFSTRENEKPSLPQRSVVREGVPNRLLLLRTQYRELVRIRKVIRVWEQIRNSLAAADREREEPVEYVNLLIALEELLPLVPQLGHLIGGRDEPGYFIVSLAKRPAPLELLRTMTPSQRESLTQDCRAAHYRLVDAYRRLRATLRQGREKSFVQKQLRPAVRELFCEPKWLCLIFGTIALIVASVRG
jgi:hypothetical protein